MEEGGNDAFLQDRREPKDERFARLPDLFLFRDKVGPPIVRFKTRQMLLIYPHVIKRVKHV